MGAALNTASASNAYVLADRGTWLSFKNRGDLDIVVEGDKRLFNQYGVILVNPAKHRAREEGARPGLHRLAGLAGRPEGDRRLQDQRPAAVLPERRRCRARDARRARSSAHALLVGGPRMAAPAIAADPVLLHAAGSLRARADRGGERVRGRVGHQGAGEVRRLGHAARTRSPAARSAEVFASANMEHPQALASAGKSGPVVLFARNRLCALVRPGLAVDARDAARAHARPAT